MLIPRGAGSDRDGRQGCPRVGFAELRRQLANPSKLNYRHRQRLLELARRLARVQALGDGYARVEFSWHVAAVLEAQAAAT